MHSDLFNGSLNTEYSEFLVIQIMNNTAIKWLEGFNLPDSYGYQEFIKQDL